MKRLAISMRVVSTQDYFEPRDAISHDWIVFVSGLGYRVLLIPNVLSDPAGYMVQERADTLVLTGGNDFAPLLSAESDVSPERNKTERVLLDAAIRGQMPVFAACRGLHVVNDYFGGNLTLDLKVAVDDSEKHVNNDHIIGLAGPFAGLTDAQEIEVNSFHRQGVVQDQLAPCLFAFAVSSADGIVEGLVHRELPILAVQWHPERPNPSSRFDMMLFHTLINEGAFWRGAL